jgi:hypothetical protein
MKFSLAGIEFFSFKPYKHRWKNRISQGVHGHITERGYIYFHEQFYTVVKDFEAYTIGFKNKNSFPVDVEVELSTYDRSGSITHTFREKCTFIKPGENGSINFRLPEKSINVKLGKVLLYNHNFDDPFQAVNVNRMLPGKPFAIKGWIVAFITTFMTLGGLTEPVAKNFAVFILPLIAFLLMIFGFLNRTPTWLMFIYLILVPFTPYSRDMKIAFMLLGAAYMYVVWVRRRSFKDFVRSSSTDIMLL